MFERATAHFAFPQLLRACAVLLCVALPAFPQVAIDWWTADNGLPLNTVTAICQTPDGYLWLATLDGLGRFDGVRFTTFNKSNTKGIGGNRFNWMFCTADGGFWAATEGSGVTQYRQGRFTTYTVRDGLPSDSITGISGDEHGNLWVLAGGFVSQWRAAERRFVPLAHEFTYSGALSADGHSVFCRIDQTGLHVLARGEPSHYALPAGWPQGAPTIAGEDLNQHIWLATPTGEWAQFVDGAWSIHGGKKRLTSDYRDSQGKVWHSEMGWESGSRLVRYLVLPSGAEPARIAFNTLFEDREGNLWLATDGQGLCRVRAQKIDVYSKEQGLPDRNVYVIYQSRDSAVWIGTWSSGLCRFADGKFTTYTTVDGLASNRVNAILEDRDGVVWVAVDHGLHRMRNGRFESVSRHGVGSADAGISAIHQDPKGVIWFGSIEGLLRFEQGQWRLLTKKDGLATEDIRVIIDGRDGNLWVGGYGGLSSLRDGHVRAWTEQDGVASNTIRALYEDADGVLWIGTYDGGLGRFEKGRFTRYTVDQGLFDNGVFQILEDSRANFWMSSNRGIYRASKQQLNDLAAGKTRTVTSVAYGKRDGMRNIECNGGLTPAGVKARDGKLWFPTQDGAAVIDPEKLVANPKPPPVVIEACRIDRAAVALDGPVRVTPGRENFEIEYTALSLTNSEQIRFKYQLSGLDRDWVEAGTRRTAYYSHLPPGSYTFKVTAAESNSGWNEAGANFTFLVLPPFYRTWWFLLVWSGMAATCLWLFWRYRLGQLERARAAQQAFSHQLIASQENERKRLAAELHDSLGQRLVIIKNLALLLLHPRSGAAGLSGRHREKVEEISAEVSGAVGEVKEISYNLRPYRLDRLGLTAALRAMIETASAASSTTFAAEIDDIDDVFPKPAEINFYRIVQECVNNILKHSEARQAIIRIGRTQERLMLIVQDDGSGFAPDAGHTGSLGGFGLTGISERAQLLGGTAEIQSAPGKGTTVTIEIDGVCAKKSI